MGMNEKLTQKALEIMEHRSKKALEATKDAMLKEHLESSRATDALKYYAESMDDTTRPAVVSLAHDAVNQSSEEIIPMQVSLLLIAATMDIHDDVIDKSKTKNGRPTVLGKYGEETALLLGDALLVKGFCRLSSVIQDLPREQSNAILDTVQSFLLEVTDAHLIEAELREKKWDVKPDEYVHVLEKKAADIEGRMRIGAVFGKGLRSQVEALSAYGKNLGILLALRSEFVDLYEHGELSHRIKHECLPLPVVYAIQDTAHREKIEEILSTKKVKDVIMLVKEIYRAPGVVKLREYVQKVQTEALLSLQVLPRSRAKEDLKILVEAMTEDL